MNFYRWMMKKHLNTKAPVGDLARDMKGDKEFPRDGSLDEILEYLESKGACFGARMRDLRRLHKCLPGRCDQLGQGTSGF